MVGFVLGLFALASAFNLTILHTGLIRGQVLPVNGYYSGCSMTDALADMAAPVGEGSCYGGIARQVTYTSRVREAMSGVQDVVLFDVGDYYHGSLFFTRDQGVSNRRFFNYLNYTAFAPGVEDFWTGPDPMKFFLQGMTATLPKAICSNLYPNNQSVLYNMFDRWGVLDFNGTKVGVVAAMNELLRSQSNSGPYVIVNPPTWGPNTVENIRTAVFEMLEANPTVKIVILLSSLYDDPLELSIARSVYDIDIVIREDQNAAPPGVNGGWPSYPLVESNSVGSPFIIVSSGRHGAYMGHLNVTFNSEGVLTSWNGMPILLDNSIPVDPLVWPDVVATNALVDIYKNTPVGYSTNPIGGEWGTNDSTVGCRWSDCAIGYMITRAMMNLCPDCDFAIQNVGGLVQGIPQGNVTTGDLLNAMPFQNTMATLSLRGASVIDALENAINQPADSLRGPFAQLSGLRFAFNPNQSVDLTQRVVAAEVWRKPSGGAAGYWEPIQANLFYKLATNSFARSGGDGYSVLTTGVNYNDFLPALEEVATIYFQANNPLTLPTDAELMECTKIWPSLKVDSNNRIVWPNNCTLIKTYDTQSALGRCDSDINLCQSLTKNGTQIGNLFGIPIDPATCDTCSGLGSCQLQQCICSVPQSGLFEGSEVARGSVCSNFRAEWMMSEGARAFAIALSIFTIAVAFICSLGYFYYRKYKVMIRSSPVFNHLTSFGAVMAGVGVIISTPPLDSLRCNAWISLVALAFVLVYGSLFAKTYRVYKIFVVAEIFLKRVTDWDVMRIVLGFLVMEGICLAVPLGVAKLDIGVKILPLSFEYASICTSDSVTLLISLLIAANGVLVLWGLYLALVTRHVETDFNESRSIAVCIYNLTFSCLFLLPIILALESNGTLEAAFVVRAVLINYVVLFTLLTLFVPKFIAIQKGQGNTELKAFSAYMHSGSGSQAEASSVASPGSTSSGGDKLELRGIDDLDNFPAAEKLRVIRRRLKKVKEFEEFLQSQVVMLEEAVKDAKQSEASAVSAVPLTDIPKSRVEDAGSRTDAGAAGSIAEAGAASTAEGGGSE